MLKKIKDFLGIEGVKISLEDIEANAEDKLITGTVRCTSQSDQTIMSLQVKLVEKYSRGKNESQLINEYLLGELIQEVDMDITKDETKDIQFELPYNHMKSEMDKIEDDNLILKPFVKLAKYLKRVKSFYRLEASVNVKGTSLDPIVSETLEL